jgi:hypothetical protein
MAIACGIEFSDFGFNAAVSTDGAPPKVVLAESEGNWPGFAAWDGQKLVFGRTAEQRSRLQPRAASHTFWELLSLAPSDMEGPPRIPAYSELAYAFLKEFWAALEASVGKPDAVSLAMPGQILGDENEEGGGVGLILAMARDIGIPLTNLCGLSTATLNDPESTSGLNAKRILYLDLHLHSAVMSLLENDGAGTMHRRRHLRLPRLGYVPLIQGLQRAMGNRFLRATAFDVTAQRELDQEFYEQTREQLLDASHSTDIRYSIQTASRIHQAAFPREILLRDLLPIENGWADAAVKFLRDGALSPKDVVVAVSSRGRILPALHDALIARGFAKIVKIGEGAAARGAARFAADLKVCADVSDVPIITEVGVASAAAASGGEVRMQHLAAVNPKPGLMASHLVVDGAAYSLHALPECLTGGDGGVAPISSLARLGDVKVLLTRAAGEWQIEVPQSGLAPAKVMPGDRVMVQTNAGGEVELSIVAECRPGQA